MNTITETNIFETLMANEEIQTRDENGKKYTKAIREELMMELTRNLVKSMSRETEIDFRFHKLGNRKVKISKQANGTYLVEGHEGSNAAALREIIADITGEDVDSIKERKFTTRQLGGQAYQLIQTELQKREEKELLKAEAKLENEDSKELDGWE